MLLLAFVLLISTSAVAGDWPQVLGPNRDGVSEETIEPWPGEPTIRWRVGCGAGYAGVAVRGQNVLLWHRVAGDEVLDCLSTVDGQRRWRATFPASYRGGVDADRGPRCVPVVANDTVIVCGASGDLHAVSLTDGSTMWSRELRADYDADEGYFGAGSTPIVVGDVVITTVGGRTGAGLVAVSKSDGKTRWTCANEAAAYASPVTITIEGVVRVIAVLGLQTVMVDPQTGEIISQFDFGRRGPTVNAATPLVDGTNVFVTASYGIGCRMIDMASDPPKDLWDTNDVISSQYATPVRVGDWLFAISGREDMGDAELKCVRWADGAVAWTQSPFGTAHLIATGNRVLAQTTKGRLILFAATEKRYEALATADLPPGTYKSLPAIADGVLFCRRTMSATEGEILAIEP